MGVPVDHALLLEHILHDVKQVRALEHELAQRKMYLVVIPDEGMHSVTEYSTVAELVVELRQLVARVKEFPTPPAVLVFRGERWHITKGPHHQLLSPNKDVRHSLLQADDEDEIDASGVIGRT
jgi:hypothetical protein